MEEKIKELEKRITELEKKIKEQPSIKEIANIIANEFMNSLGGEGE